MTSDKCYTSIYKPPTPISYKIIYQFGVFATETLLLENKIVFKPNKRTYRIANTHNNVSNSKQHSTRECRE